MSIDDQIEEIVDKSEPGTIFFPIDFYAIGSQGAIHTTLHRLVARKALVRLGQGIYAKPKMSILLNQIIAPSAEDVAIALARRDKAKLLPSGSYALYALGLSTQIPLKLVYYTDAKPRKIKIGNRSILFRKTTPKKLSMQGVISKLVVQALSEIGMDQVTDQHIVKILEHLKKENITHLKHDIAVAPQWIAEIMAKAL